MRELLLVLLSVGGGEGGALIERRSTLGLAFLCLLLSLLLRAEGVSKAVVHLGDLCGNGGFENGPPGDEGVGVGEGGLASAC